MAPPSHPVDISLLAQQARAFEARLLHAKRQLGDPGFEWYPYDTLSALSHLDGLLTGKRRTILNGRGRMLDMGSQDGELAFFLESLGYEVVAIDHPRYNHNGMRGIRALKAALGSGIEIHEMDVDRPFTLPHDTYDLVCFLGILYHLRNPFYVLEELARRTTHCLLSTRVARRFPDGAPMPANVALAYLVGADELNRDESNYFIFSEAGLRLMLERSHWRILDYVSVGNAALSDPVHPDRDERAFCLLETQYTRLANLELLSGWHESEETGWRWAERRFAARVPVAAERCTLIMNVYLPPDSLRRLGPVTLEATVNGAPLLRAVFDSPGLSTYVRELETTGDLELIFQTDKALLPDEDDSRERALIVTSIEVV